MTQPAAPRAKSAGWSLWPVLEQLVRVGLIAGLGICLVFLGWRWGQALWRYRSQRRLAQLTAPAAPPIPPPLAVNEWLARAQQAQRQGDYTQACRSLYCAMVQLLNDRAVVSDRLNQTNGEYQQLVQDWPRAIDYQTLIQTHEQIHFGGAQVDAAQYQRCQKAYQGIEQQQAAASPVQSPRRSRPQP